MPSARNYEDACGTARALDVIGERWALLVVRELLLGPKRFSQLRRGLHGVSPNVLSQRLRELEDAGIARREMLAPPANVAVYELTERGKDLEPVLIELGRWGSREPITAGNELTIDALLLAFKTVFVAPSFTATYALQVGTEWYTVAVADSGIDVVRGRPSSPSVTFECDVATLRTFAFGRTSLPELEAAGRLIVIGNRTLARRFPRLFQVPPT